MHRSEQLPLLAVSIAQTIQERVKTGHGRAVRRRLT